MKEKYIYPCIIYEDDGIYYANFKDFDACFTDGDSIEEVIINAKDVLEGTIFSLLKNNFNNHLRSTPKKLCGYLSCFNKKYKKLCNIQKANFESHKVSKLALFYNC